MKKLFLGLLVLCGSYAVAAPTQVDVMIGVSDALIPGGFDAQSEVNVVVSGMFSNGCYRWKEAQVEHHPAEKIHAVRSYATVYQGMCPMVLVPFMKEVNLGQLGAGEHKIRFLNGDGTYMEKVLTLE